MLSDRSTTQLPRRAPQSLSLGSFGDFRARPVRTTIFIILFVACQVLAADPNPPILIAREYRVAPEFLTWMNPKKSPPGWDKQPKEWLGQSGVPFSVAPTSVYVSESQRLIVRHTKDYHDALNRLVTEWRKQGRKKQPDSKTLQTLRDLDATHKQ